MQPAAHSDGTNNQIFHRTSGVRDSAFKVIFAGEAHITLCDGRGVNSYQLNAFTHPVHQDCFAVHNSCARYLPNEEAVYF
jgi:hypothetical protein